jgi:site-specific DNA-adenine methylase
MNNKIVYFFTRDGNKLVELKHYINLLPSFDAFNIYCEPYAGSFGALRGIHQQLENNNIKIHLNDLDSYLHEEWNWIINEDIEKVKLITDMMASYLYPGMYIGKMSEEKKIFTDVMSEIETEGIPRNILNRLTDSITHMGLVNNIKYIDTFIPLRELLKKSTITHKNAIELFEEYKNNTNAFLFLDPPYLDTNIKNYGNSNKRSDIKNILDDNSIHYIKMLEMLETAQCKIMAIINKTYLTDYLFKKFIRHEYKKTYGRSGSRTIHIVLTNY